MSRHKRGVNRRAFLRGAGSAAIALPLSVSLPRRADSNLGVIPHRYISLYFGNGLPKKFATAGYTGVLAPLAPYASRMAMIRGLSLSESGGGDLHYKGTARFAKGFSPRGESSAGGPSLDYEAFRKYGEGTTLLNVNMHTEVTGGQPATRWYHSWRGVNQPNDELLKPLDVFRAVFGTPPPSSGGDPGLRPATRVRYNNSVLDAVVGEYQHVMSDASGYSRGQRALIGDHLTLVRELERDAVAADDAIRCDAQPVEPPDLMPSQACTAELCPGDDRFYYGSGGTNWNEVWRLNARIFAAAMRCGETRFGTLGCTGGGDRYPVPELRDLGVTESPHVLAHDWSPIQENGFDICVTWIMQKIAFFLDQLADPAWLDPNGLSVLDNTLVLIGTELGTGGGGQHRVDYMSYFLAGGGGRIRTMNSEFSGKTDVDLYSTVAKVMGLGDSFGDPTDFTGHLDIIA